MCGGVAAGVGGGGGLYLDCLYFDESKNRKENLTLEFQQFFSMDRI